MYGRSGVLNELYKDNHENTKEGKHEILIFFRIFVFSCFRDKFFQPVPGSGFVRAGKYKII